MTITMPAAPFKLALTLAEAADACGYSISTIKRAVERGELTKRYANSNPVILVSELTEWLESLPEVPPKTKR